MKELFGRINALKVRHTWLFQEQFNETLIDCLLSAQYYAIDIIRNRILSWIDYGPVLEWFLLCPCSVIRKYSIEDKISVSNKSLQSVSILEQLPIWFAQNWSMIYAFLFFEPHNFKDNFWLAVAEIYQKLIFPYI